MEKTFLHSSSICPQVHFLGMRNAKQQDICKDLGGTSRGRNFSVAVPWLTAVPSHHLSAAKLLAKRAAPERDLFS